MANTAQILFLLLVAAAVQCHGAHRYHGRSHGRYRPHDYYRHHRHSGENGPHDNKNSSGNENKRVATLLNGEANGVLPNDVGASVVANGPSLEATGKAVSGSAATDAGLNVELGSSADKPDDIAAMNVNGDNSPKDGNVNEDNKVEDENGAGKVDGMSSSGSNEQPAGEGNLNVGGSTPGGEIDTGINGDLPNGDIDNPSGNINVNGLEPGHSHGSQSSEDNSEPDQDDNSNGHSSNEGKDIPDQDDNTINVDGLSPNEGDSEKNENGKPEDNDYHSGHDHNGRPEYDNDINVNGLSPGEDEEKHYGHHGHGWPSHDHVGRPHHNNVDAFIHQPDHNNIDQSFIQKPNIDLGIEGGLPPGYTSSEENDGLLHQKPNSKPSGQPIFPGADILPYPTLIPGQYPSIGIPNKVDDKEFDGKKNNSMLIPVMLPGGGHILLPSSSLGGIASYIIVMINGRPTLIQNPGFAHGLSVGGAVLPNWSQLPAWLGGHLPSAGGAVLVPNSEPVQPVPVPVPVPEPVPAPQPTYNIPYPAYYWPSHWNSGTPSSPDLQKLVDLLINISSRLPKQRPALPSPQIRPIPIPAYPYPQYPYPYPPSYPYPPFVYPGKYPGIKPTGSGKAVPDTSLNVTAERDDDIPPTIHEPEIQPEKRPRPDRQPEVQLKPKPEDRPDFEPEVDDKPKPDTRPKPRPEVHPEYKPEVDEKPKPEDHPDLKQVFPEKPDVIPEKPEVIPKKPEVIPEKPEVIPEKPEVIPEKPEVIPRPQPEVIPRPQPEVIPRPQPEVIPGPQPEVIPTPQPEIIPTPQPEIIPTPQPEIIPTPQPEIIPTPQPEIIPTPQPEVIPTPQPEVIPTPQPEVIPRPQPEIHEKPEPRPEKPREEHLKPERDRPDSKHDTHIHITLPKPTHVGKPTPSQPGLDSGLVDILNILLKFPDRNSHPTKNLGPLIKLLLSILKPGDKTQTLIPSLNEQIQGQPDLGNLGSLLLHILDGRKEPNLNVLVEPGMDEATRTNIILLLNLLASNLGGSYPDMGYYQPQNPLLYFLGHFPCDHPNIPAISGMSSGSNLWQLLAKMYGRNLGRTEFRLERSAEETDDKPAEPAKDSQVKSDFVAA